MSKIQQTFTECTQLLLLLLELEGRFFRMQDRTAYIHSTLALCGSTLFQVLYFTEKRNWSHTFSPLVLFLSRMQIPSDWTTLRGLCEFVSAARLGCPAKEQVISVSNFIESAAGGSANGCRHCETERGACLCFPLFAVLIQHTDIRLERTEPEELKNSGRHTLSKAASSVTL